MTIRKLNEEADRQRVKNLWRFEEETGCNIIAGVDEVGRGCLFGSMIISAVILPKNIYLSRLDDSKKLSPKLRAELFDRIKSTALAISVVEVSVEEIDAVNIYQATKNGMVRAVEGLTVPPEFVLTDAMKLELPVSTRAIVHGDRLSASIAAASIIAKVTRDRLAESWAKEFPQYGLERNKGYGTREHLQAIERFGFTDFHRKSFNPVKSMLKGVI